MATTIQEPVALVNNANAKITQLTTGGNPSVFILTSADAILATVPIGTFTTPNATTGVFSPTTVPIRAAASGTGIAAKYAIKNGAGTQLYRGVAGKFAFTADDTTEVLTALSHDFANAEMVYVASSGTLPAPLAVDTIYHVRDVATNTFKLAATVGGVAIDITTAGTGTFFVYRITSAIRIPANITADDIVSITSLPFDVDSSD